MKENAQSLRRALQAVRRPRPNTPYPRQLRAKAAAYIEKRRTAGEAWGKIAAALGVSSNTAFTWHEVFRPKVPASKIFLPVTMKKKQPEDGTREKSSGVSLLTPEGFRFEGLDVKEAAELWRNLR